MAMDKTKALASQKTQKMCLNANFIILVYNLIYSDGKKTTCCAGENQIDVRPYSPNNAFETFFKLIP